MPGGEQPALWGRPGHRPAVERALSGEVLDRLGEAQGCCGSAVADCNLPPQKTAVWRGPAPCKGLRNLSPPADPCSTRVGPFTSGK